MSSHAKDSISPRNGLYLHKNISAVVLTSARSIKIQTNVYVFLCRLIVSDC